MTKQRKILNLIVAVGFALTTAYMISQKNEWNWSILQYSLAGLIGLFIIFPLLDLAQGKNAQFKAQLKLQSRGIMSSKHAKCYKCKTPMLIITGPIKINSMQDFKGCFKCHSCGRYTCFDCSDASMACKCGSQIWLEQLNAIN